MNYTSFDLKAVKRFNLEDNRRKTMSSVSGLSVPWRGRDEGFKTRRRVRKTPETTILPE